VAYWRIRFRDGNHGPDLWSECRGQHVAAITYAGIEEVDLSHYSRENRPPGWAQLQGSASASMRRFAWEILGGDALYVADSGTGQIVGMGHARATIEELAYRFDPGSRIVSRGQRWRH
jgi:hypothetical protein